MEVTVNQLLVDGIIKNHEQFNCEVLLHIWTSSVDVLVGHERSLCEDVVVVLAVLVVVEAAF